ncbi:hypothetical protein GCM10023149_30610 [Mucilaginibacter gynuensis]|uniref:Oligosaccharide repeat unit polymerase n=1 Tax=Mucilaginibacter gynuensis TaxID=1302236 RepID=A0ABP8GNH1_9SPHI
MDWYTFGLLLYDNLYLYLGILAVSLFLYFILFKKNYISFLDPLIFNLIYSVFGFSVVVFLYATQSIELKYFISYLLTQAAFFIGLFFFKPLTRNSIVSGTNVKTYFEYESMLIKLLFMLTSVTYIFVQLLSYKLVGIPLFLESRLGAYADSGGLGILGRVLDVLRPATAFLLVYLLLEVKKGAGFKFYLFVYTVFLLLSFALSGSKSLFMSLGFVLFIYLILNAQKLKRYFFNLRKYERYIIAGGLSFAFIVIFAQLKSSDTGEGNSLNIFLYRLVASGDTYYFSYPNNNIETINGSKYFLALFGDIFSTLRIVPRDYQPEVLGVQLFHIYTDADLIAGPNARHNVFGYIYYGMYGSIIFSFLIGFSLGFLRNKLFFSLKKNVIGQLLFMFLYINLCFIETDPPVAMTGIENVLLIFPVFLILAFMLYVPLYNMKKQKVGYEVG